MALQLPLLGLVRLLALAAAAGTAAATEQAFLRIALLIANGRYAGAGTAVPPAVKDARLRPDALERIAFPKTLQDDEDPRAMQAAVEAFEAWIGQASSCCSVSRASPFK